MCYLFILEMCIFPIYFFTKSTFNHTLNFLVGFWLKGYEFKLGAP